ncbi:hypothetical protein [Mesorhizobium mediterraneum]|uniref:hypothetical protein n=1 Tax=Mesorhizobium mediterraneum TaxID=43617 RepID=UPI00178375A3|nr:hypothetical protein [Mesorhizobium mediterraneum]
MTRYGLVPALAISAATCIGVGEANSQSFDGITIIEFSDDAGKQIIASGDHIITFVSARGSYAAVVGGKGSHGGCQSLAAPGSYTGASISFGIAAEPIVRKHRLQTYCPPFTIRLENPETVHITSPGDPASGQKGYEVRQKIVAHIPLRAVDFESPPFSQHDVKGVRLGPVLNPDGLGGLSAPGGSSDRHKYLTRQVEGEKGRNNVQGQAAAAEVTGWPWDVLYFLQYIEGFKQTSTVDAFDSAVQERYGEPSSVYEQSGYRLWLYNLDGQKLALDAVDQDECRKTIEFWLQSDPLKRVHALGWEFNSYDIGPWGCSLVMELNPNRGSGGVTGYSVRAASGYVMAINHFLQRVEETTELLGKVQALQGRKPKF